MTPQALYVIKHQMNIAQAACYNLLETNQEYIFLTYQPRVVKATGRMSA